MREPTPIEMRMNPPKSIEVGSELPIHLNAPTAAIFAELYICKNNVCDRGVLETAIERTTHRTHTEKSQIVSAYINALRVKLNNVDSKNYPNLGWQLIRTISNGEGKTNNDYILIVPEDCSLALINGRYLYNRNTLGL